MTFNGSKMALYVAKNMRNVLIAALVIVVLLADRYDLFGVSGGAAPPQQVAGRAEIIDGDSLRVGGHELRLRGIDAPEGRQMCQKVDGSAWACGRQAASRLRRLIGRSLVQCRIAKRDQYRRLLATCRVDGTAINRRMVADGWAVSYGAYRHAEAAAKAARRGIWSGTFMRPRDWRNRHKGRR